jgi:hypothetical protein
LTLLVVDAIKPQMGPKVIVPVRVSFDLAPSSPRYQRMTLSQWRLSGLLPQLPFTLALEDASEGDDEHDPLTTIEV